MSLRPILELSDRDFAEWLDQQGHARYRMGQVRRWLFENRAVDFEGMSDLPKDLRQRLGESFQIGASRVVQAQRADDGTEKLLLEFAEGGRIECVLLRDGGRRSICVSSQVGCAMGCVFCASGLDGVDRNLRSGEILEQMLRLQQLLPAEERLSHIVVMGMGEPLANLDQLLPALERASDKHGLGISARRITISTVGLPAAIRRLTRLKSRFQLAVSLHAPNDELRNQLVPVNRNIGIDEILAAADEYFQESGRRLTYEYVLLADINDQAEHAHQLASILRGRTALLNVIPYNPVAGLPYRTPSSQAIRLFREILESRGVNVQFRQRKGDEIDAACGQLRRSSASSLVSLDAPHKQR